MVKRKVGDGTAGAGKREEGRKEVGESEVRGGCRKERGFEGFYQVLRVGFDGWDEDEKAIESRRLFF